MNESAPTQRFNKFVQKWTNYKWNKNPMKVRIYMLLNFQILGP